MSDHQRIMESFRENLREQALEIQRAGASAARITLIEQCLHQAMNDHEAVFYRP